MAGLFFFRYSIEHGLIPPWLRVVLATLTGVGCLVASETLVRDRYPTTANPLAGAGVVILYASFWAAHTLYGLVGAAPAFVGMIAVTVTCTTLAWLHASLVIALLGLAGGFATPLLVNTGADRPIGLFGYLLLLNLAILLLARRRGWPGIALASLVVTALYETFWLGWRMEPERLALGLAVLGVFALVFAASGHALPARERRGHLLTQAGGVLFPFAFALYLAGSARFGTNLYPLALLLVPLSLAAGWIGRQQEQDWLSVWAASAALAVEAVWLFARPLDDAIAREASVVTFAIALPYHFWVERDREGPVAKGAALAAVIVTLGSLLLVIGASGQQPGVSLWSWLPGWLALAALGIRHGGLPGRGPLLPATSSALAVGLARFALLRGQVPGDPPVAGVLAVSLAVAIVLQLVALAHRRFRSLGSSWAEHGAAAAALIAALALASPEILRELSGPLALAAVLALGILTTLCATRLGVGPWALVGMAGCALGHTAWSFATASRSEARELVTALAIQCVSVAIFTGWRFAVGGRFERDRFACYASALAPAAWFLSLRSLFELRFGGSAIGLLPLALGALALAAALRSQRTLPFSDPSRRRGLVWHLAVALAFLTVAIPLQLERQWITIGWALEGLALVLLWLRLDHPGLKWVGLALLGAVTLRLVANPALLGYYTRSGWPILNWLLYTYLVPATCLLATASVLSNAETARARSFERPLYASGRPIGAIAAGLAGLVVIFVWINLAIFDFYAEGPALVLSFERASARDLTMSLAWAVYALALLALGLRGGRVGLRWAGLVLAMITATKVFLHDLGELRDLYRVASLVGLAASLILISLAYQRVALNRPPPGAD